MTEKAFLNALTVDMALGCSTNSMLHLPAIAHEFGLELDADKIDRLHRLNLFKLQLMPAFEYNGDIKA